jgi:DnaJ-class molecular chaperone
MSNDVIGGDGQRSKYCVRCDGRGRLTAHSVPCSRCGGSGYEPKRETTNGRP